MSLSPGTKLAHYEIVEPIGKGGMGEVYRAKDSKLGRDVAIKVLPEEFARDEERLRRFQREAKVLASLNHPNIAAIYGVEASQGTHYLVLELVPGETLADRISRGRMPVDEAVRIATKIAEALEEAHEQGIVHRDLKPANVKLTEDGKVKVLDFGLAKAFTEETAEVDSSMSPTITRDATRVGVILGTAAYMSPEQAKGKRVDKRTDLFAFGALLYEMLTGKKAFPGDDVSEVLAAVIKLEPDFEALPAESRALLKRCLSKDVRKRYRDIGDVSFDLDGLQHGKVEKPASMNRRWLIAAAVPLAFALGVGVTMLRSTPPTANTTIRSQLLPPEGEEFAGYTVELSPNGEWVAFTDRRVLERRRLWARRLDELDARPLPGTEGARFPFWSPDSRSIGFLAGDELKVVSPNGGAPRTVVGAPGGLGGSWNRDGLILFAGNPGGLLYRVDAAGGDAVAVTTRGEESAHIQPYFFPDGRHFLYFTNAPRSVYLGDLETGASGVLIENGFDAKYVSSGWITYVVRGDSLFAQRFDVDRLERVGEPVSLVADLMSDGPWGGHYSFSGNGLLVYLRGGRTQQRLLWMDRSGVILDEGPDREDAPGWTFRISPSGSQLAVGGQELGVLDLDRGVFQRVPTSPEGAARLFPAWSPDESRIAYRTDYGIRIAAVDGSSDEELIRTDEMIEYQLDWSPDGHSILYARTDADTGGNAGLWLVGVEGGSSEAWLSGDANYGNGRFSPDGRWVAYRSDETGVSEVYVRPFPGPGRPTRVSLAGGSAPEWRGDGGELFFLTLEGDLMAVDVGFGNTIEVSPPKELIAQAVTTPNESSTNYVVTEDGERFLTMQRGDPGAAELVQGWTNLLEE